MGGADERLSPGDTKVPFVSVANELEASDRPRYYVGRPNNDVDVDDRLGRKPGNSSTTYMLDCDSKAADGLPNIRPDEFDDSRPLGVILNQD